MNLVLLSDHVAHWRDHGPPWPVFPLLLLLLAGVIVGVVLWTRRSNRSQSATAIVAERYARGEIELDDYRQRLAHLTEKRG